MDHPWRSTLAAALLLAACEGPRLDFPTCTDVGADLTFATTPTWADDVGPIVQARCAECHQDGGVAPIALTDPTVAATFATAIRDAVVSRRMPPPGPTSCGECNEYLNASWLDPKEIATLRAWADGGAPLGEGAAPVVAAQPSGLDRVDLLLQIAEPYTPDASQPDEYRCFIVPSGTTTDGFITGWEGRPGDTREVHHILLYTIEPGSEGAAALLDAASPGEGYSCFGGPSVPTGAAGGWVPGSDATLLPAGTGLPVPAGASFILQVHYNLGQGATPDQTGFALKLEPTVNVQGAFALFAKNGFKLQPGQEAVTIEQVFPAFYPAYPGTITLWGVLPHMHTLGTALHAEMWNKDSQTCVTDATPWDFSNQSVYMYKDPLVVKGTDRMRLSCTYDTRTRTEVTRNGEGTADEMCLIYVYGTPGGPEAALGK